MKCNLYTESRCMGTKERDLCSCDGDTNKCSFYKKEPTFIDIVNARHRLCKKFQSFTNCEGCPIAAAKAKYCLNSHITCADFMFSYSRTVLTALDNYNKEHPENPTWHEWLNYVYDYYKGFGIKETFTEWLDTEISEEEALNHNIPTKEQLNESLNCSRPSK